MGMEYKLGLVGNWCNWSGHQLQSRKWPCPRAKRAPLLCLMQAPCWGHAPGGAAGLGPETGRHAGAGEPAGAPGSLQGASLPSLSLGQPPHSASVPSPCHWSLPFLPLQVCSPLCLSILSFCLLFLPFFILFFHTPSGQNVDLKFLLTCVSEEMLDFVFPLENVSVHPTTLLFTLKGRSN